MNQSAVYRSSKRELDQAEADLPVKRPCLHPIYRSSKRELDQVKSDVSVKRPCLHPIAAHRVICRFLISRDSPPVFVPNLSVNKPPVTVPNSLVNESLVTVLNSPVNKPCPQPDDGETSRRKTCLEAMTSLFWSLVNESPVTVPNSPVNKPCPQPERIYSEVAGDDILSYFRRRDGDYRRGKNVRQVNVRQVKCGAWWSGRIWHVHLCRSPYGFTSSMANRQEIVLPENASEELVFSELNRQLPRLGLCIEALLNMSKGAKFTTHEDLDRLLTRFLGELGSSIESQSAFTEDLKAKLLTPSMGQVQPWYAILVSVEAGLKNLVAYATRYREVDSIEYRAKPIVHYAFMSDEDFKSVLLRRMREFALMTTWACGAIAMLAQALIDDCPRRTILVHGYSTVVLEVLKNAVEPIKVFCTIGGPSQNGIQFCSKLLEHGISANTLYDVAVAHRMRDIDMVLVGASGVDKSGGIISQIGTSQVAFLAKDAGVPVFVAAETFKFGARIPKNVDDVSSEYDYTEAKYIDKIISDSGVLSPDHISRELTFIYNGRFPL